ncbi:hypothetical protein BJ170DRAFT_613946 [Xylariales sp. AK1849]|nr:hypothetical protein BJ170DRAFT_613946 [Xylariales sp. AK1849]
MGKASKMPPKVAPDTVYVISSFIWDDDYEVEGLQQPEIYATFAAANNAAKKMLFRYAEKLNPFGDVDEYNFHHYKDADGLYYGDMDGGPGGHTATKIRVSRCNVSDGALSGKASKAALKGKMAVKSGSEDEDEDEGDEAEEAPAKPPSKKTTAPPKTAINAKTHRKTIPKGQPDCLQGLKLLFTGTFETMDRKTSIATAMKYGAEVISKLEDTDYIVIGTRAGLNKLREINEKELETISEEEFFQILENGIPSEKRDRMENRRKADVDEGPEEKDEVVKPKRRLAASKGAPARKRAKR